MIDPDKLKARADEILDAMPEDDRPIADRVDEAVRIALAGMHAEQLLLEEGSR